jgi:NO-binding membrane sensor protein with MHYT domain
VRGDQACWASTAALAPAVAPLLALAPLAVAAQYRRARGDATARLIALRLYGATLCGFVFVTGLTGRVFAPAPSGGGPTAAGVVADALMLGVAPAIGCVLLTAAAIGLRRLARDPFRTPNPRRR